MRLNRPFRAVFLACIAALLNPAPAVAQRVISNVATIRWDSGTGVAARASNQVDITVDDGEGPALGFARPVSGIVPADVLTASCGAQGTASPNVGTLPGDAATSLIGGRTLILALTLPNANQDPSQVETVDEVVTTSSGDQETVRFVETGADTGRFQSVIPTRLAPNPVAPGDCRLAVAAGSTLTVTIATPTGAMLARSNLAILVDPFGIAFDSRSGTPVEAVRITLIDAATGQPANVFGDDGVSTFPSTIVTGQTVTDSGGASYVIPAGEYRFPLVATGSYRLLVEPVAPYTFPSGATAEQIAALQRPDGGPFVITQASYGAVFALTAAGAIQVDVPLDRPVTPLIIAKAASRADAEAGDIIQYAVTLRNSNETAPSGPILVRDTLPEQLRFRSGSARRDRTKIADPAVSERDLVFTIPGLAAGASTRLTYIAEVRPDARAGEAVNRVSAFSAGVSSNIADATVRILRDTIADRMTLTGRVLLGGCAAGMSGKPVVNVKVLLEDGSYAVSDLEGRFHFEGLATGSHVVAIDRSTLPAGLALVDCARDTRSGGSAISRLVDGRGGELKDLTFYLEGATTADTAQMAVSLPKIASDAAAAGAERDWLAGQQPGIGWLFPDVDYNPRAPVTRVAIKHLPGQKVSLAADGKPVDPIAFDGTVKNEMGVAVSQWRGLPLHDGSLQLRAEVRAADGTLVETLTRTVAFTNDAVSARFVRERSSLLADGVHRPVIAVRLSGAGGRPARHGLVGDFELSAPYYAAMEASAEQARQLAGLERGRPTWRVDGDDGVAYIALEPTTVSGSATLVFKFRDAERIREQRLEVWLDPGDHPWTLVGLAEGSVGFNRLDKKMERLGDTKDSETDGRLALYAKGRIKGRWLLTVAYDSDKDRKAARLGGTIDPNAYYTVYADRSERRYDAASVRKLYVKLERPQFFALFGDYQTAIDEPQLARYVRSFNGVKAQYRSERVSATAFAADEPQSHRRDEIQGNGLSGPYALGARDILANSERITLETRDRLRSERIVEERVLTRYSDYEIDYRAGTLRFREPILSRDSALNPQFIVADYEVDGIAQRRLNAGGRVAVRTADQRFQVAATVVHDADGQRSADLAGADIRFRPDEATEIRAEAAVSRTNPRDGPKTATQSAWLIEVERHTRRLGLLAYARRRDSGFGLGQLNSAESGTFKIGADLTSALTQRLSLTASVWRDDYLDSVAERIAGRALLEYRGERLTSRAGLVFANDRLADGREERSTLLELGTMTKFFGNRFEVDASAQIPLTGSDDSVDFPARYRLSGRYSLSRDVALVASYEIATGEAVDARTVRLGFDVAPWAGARFAVSGNLQDLGELGSRSFAAFGVSQSVTAGKNWTFDGSLDGNRTLGGIDAARILNLKHPVATGGFIGDGSSITEDFTAMSLGATYRATLWSVTGRAEYRAGDREDRIGLILGAIRQLGDGRALGGAVEWYRAKAEAGPKTEVLSARLSWAHRPAGAPFQFLDKLELRSDRISSAIQGQPNPLGSPLLVDGDARSLRLVNSFSGSLHTADDRAELAMFWGLRFSSTKLGEDDVQGLSNLVSLSGRLSLGSSFEFGAAVSARHSLEGRALVWSAGPEIGYAPVKGSVVTVGFNVAGYADRDFELERYTRSGPYVTARLKLDELTLAALGLRGK